MKRCNIHTATCVLLFLYIFIEAQTRPNFLVIVADDMGWGDVGYHGSEIITPNIDQLKSEGIELDNHNVYPHCWPTRASLLSGRFYSRYRHSDQNTNPIFPFGTVTLAEALKRLGYDTGITGKWHMGSKPEFGPLKFGFTRSHGCLAGGVNQYNHRYKPGPYSKTWHRNDSLIEEEGHSTDLIADEVIRWIEAKHNPWFYYVAFTAVHDPIQVDPKFPAMYDGKTYDSNAGKNESFKRYAGYATHMDERIGGIIKALERTGQLKNTMVVFTSDNGAIHSMGSTLYLTGIVPGDEILPMPRLGSNLPLRGLKGTFFEGGMRVPAFVNWPGTLKPGKLEAPMFITDWMPTFLGLAGYVPDTDLKLDGKDVWPLLSGSSNEADDRTFYWKYSVGSAIRVGDWKLVSTGGKGNPSASSGLLFNLAEDPYEKNDLFAANPDKVAELLAAYAAEGKKEATRPPNLAEYPTIVVTVDRLTSESAAGLSGKVSSPDASVTVTLGGRVLTARNKGDGTWILNDATPAALAPGTYDVSARAEDPSGNYGMDFTDDELTIVPVSSVLKKYLPIDIINIRKHQDNIIFTSGNKTAEQWTASVFTMNGKKIKSKTSFGRSIIMDTGGMDEGVYIVKVSSKTGTIYKKLLHSRCVEI